MSKINFNFSSDKFVGGFKRFGSWAGETLQSNSSTIVGGLAMIGFALLCKKLNIPYSVLTDPLGGSYSNNASMSCMNKLPDVGLMMVPNNPIEASMMTICDNAKGMTSAYYKYQAADEIMDILRGQNEVSDQTKTFAIMCIRAIASTANDNYYRNCMIGMIADIGKGDI